MSAEEQSEIKSTHWFI